MDSKLVKGAFILMIGALFCKILGIIYIIPFQRMVGDEGAGLYTQGYVPYIIFLSIATAGFPSAVAKFIAKYNALGEYRIGREIFKTGQIIMLITGFSAFGIMYGLAPVIADLEVIKKAYNPDDVIAVIRAVSIAVIVVPSLSFFRGFFEGHADMVPTSVSQVVEQIVRIAFLLGSVYYILYHTHEGLGVAIQYATFAAFVGAVFGLAVLFYFWYRKKDELNALLKQDKNQLQVSTKLMFKEIIVSSIPFVLLAIALPTFQLIDNFTLPSTLIEDGATPAVARGTLGTLNLYVQSLVLIPITLATSFQSSIVPNVTRAVVTKNHKLFNQQLNEIFMTVFFIIIPAAVGMSVLAPEIYTVFYKFDEVGSSLLAVYAPVVILFSLSTVTAAILQGMNRQGFVVRSLTIGVVMKLALNIPLIHLLGAKGAVFATALGYAVIGILNLIAVKKNSKFSFHKVIRRSILVVLLSIAMGIAVFLMRTLLANWLPIDEKLGSLLILIFSIMIGVLIYFVLAYKTNLMHAVFGSRLNGIFRKLKLTRFVK